MHIPDGFLATNIWIPAWLISFTALGFFLQKIKNKLREKSIPLMGVMGAFIFAAQMVNFPIIGGTSGHLLGTVLSAVLLGPGAGVIVMSVVLTAQCFLLQDGGITALGANILNMAFAGTLSGYLIYILLRKVLPGQKGILLGASVAGWFSVVAGAGLCSLELAVSGISSLRIVLPAMLIVYSFVGIAEGIITYFVLGFILKARPDLIFKTDKTRISKKDILYGLAAAVMIVIFIAPFASSWPDGLERVIAYFP